MSDQLELFSNEPFCVRVTIEDAVRIFWDNYWKHLPMGKQTDAHRRRILLFFKGHHLDTISKADVERFRRFMKEMGYHDSTINKAHMILSRMFRKFEEYKEGKFVGGIDYSRITLPEKNPAALVPKVNEEQFARDVFLTKEQVRFLCSLCSDEDLYEIIDGLYWTSLRPSDFFKFIDKNVNIRSMVITGVQSKSVTSRKPGGLPYKAVIPLERMNVIKRRLENTKPGTPLFRRTNMQKRWQDLRSIAAKYDPFFLKVQLRDIRSLGYSHLLNDNTDAETLRQRMGWANYKMMGRYDKRPNKNLIEAAEKLVKP